MSASSLPPFKVVGWAGAEFLAETSPSKQDHQINLGRACLLIALEEESAVELHPELEAFARGQPVK
jgi:hypothetical protein